MLFFNLAIAFLKEFGLALWLASPMLLILTAVITAIGQVVGKKERWSAFDSFYWSFITATTVGYGDLRPTAKVSKVSAIVIGLLGLILTGILIAVAVYAATLAFADNGSKGKAN